MMHDGTFNDVGLCLGTKPHAIGLAMASLVDDRLTLICRRPERYAETDVTAIGEALVYGLVDQSSLAPFSTQTEGKRERVPA